MFGAIPDPTGPDWAAGIAGKADESKAIQALIDAQNVVQLEACTYYISAPIVLRWGQADSRSVYTLMSGAASPGSQLLFGAPWVQ